MHDLVITEWEVDCGRSSIIDYEKEKEKQLAE
jgi:hypothetical protein